MKILINQTVALRQKSGMGHYVSHLVRCLSQQIGSDRLILYPGGWTRSGLGGLQMLGRALRRLKGSAASAEGQFEEQDNPAAFGKNWANSWARRLQNWHYRTFWSHTDFDIYHEPNYIPFPCDKPTIITVADLSALLHPQWHPVERARHFAKNFLRGLERSAHVLTISEFSRQEILKHLPVAPEQVSCTFMGVRSGLTPLPRPKAFKVLERLGLPENYLLHVGTLEPRKNLLMLLRSYCELPSAVREKSPLILVGEWGWHSTALADFYHSHAKHKGVLHLGYAADEDLPALYGGARALVFPSHYEGFGLPPLEMMACGEAVLGSTAGAVVETVGSRAHLLDPGDELAWREAMQRVIMDDEWWSGLRQNVCEVAAPYTWERCAEATWQAYCRVAGDSQPSLLSHSSWKPNRDSTTIAQGGEARP